MQFYSWYDIIRNRKVNMGDYQHNLEVVTYIAVMTMFVMSWDYIPPVVRKVLGR